jgi:membrane peptidoglycan carboxypeptidase
VKFFQKIPSLTSSPFLVSFFSGIFQKISFSRRFFFLTFLFLVSLFFFWVFSPIVYSVIFSDTAQKNIAYQNTVFLDANNEVFYTLPKENLQYHIPLSAEQIDNDFLLLLTTKEDENFYSHWGVDFPKKAYLLGKYVLGTSHRGGSTLTEQWIKNKYFRETPRNFRQKIRESVLAVSFSPFIEKEKIITEYLNIAYFGRGAYGVEAAANRYFNKSFVTLNFLEKSFLISVLPSPNDEFSNIKNFNKKNKYYFLDIAQKNFLLDEYLLEKYKNQTLEILPLQDEMFTQKNAEYEQNKELIALIQNQIFLENIDNTVGGLKVYTDFSPSIQKNITETVAEELGRLSENNVQNAGVVVLDAQTGGIVSLVSNTKNSPENYQKMNTVLTKRPVASTIKPFLYLFAFLQGKKSDDIILDTQTDFEIQKFSEKPEYYVPHNFNGQEFGEVTLAQALANSLNISAVKLLDELGIENFYNFTKTIGFEHEENADFYGLSLALGTNESSLLELARNFSIFVHGGEQISPRVIVKIEGPDNQLIKNYVPEKKQLLTQYEKNIREKATQDIFDILQNPVNRQKVFHLSGTLGNDHGFAIKTGTSANFKDNWSVAFRDDYIIGVWTGNLDNSKMKEVSGVDGSGVILRRIIDGLE